MLDSLSNIFKITELRNKILYTLMMFAVFRAGIHIPVPGVDASVIESLFTSGNPVSYTHLDVYKRQVYILNTVK